ncbi:MAG: type VI secretion system tip protein VgrG [Candidatus Sedimenticola sp. (ex Thyasira tokunagai)]
MAFGQTEREVSISTPLGEDVLVFQRMDASESLSQPFNYELELLSEDGEIDYESLLAETATVTLLKADGSERFFNGYITNFSYAGTQDRFSRYRATLKPWLWFLSRTADCKIFQQKAVPDIIKEVFKEHGFSGDVRDALIGKYHDWEYCVQYRETDLNFVSRLMEQEGIYYYFEHEEGKHTLVLADDVSIHESVNDIPYFPPDVHNRREAEHIESWLLSSEVQPGSYRTDDFDFEKPKAELEINSSSPAAHSRADGEIYDYPGEYTETSDGSNYAKIRLQELQTPYEIAVGSGDSSKITVGSLFTLTQFPREDQNQEYLITSAEYQICSDEYISGADAGTAKIYSCQFNAMNGEKVYRPPQLTRKPVVRGPQTAMVVGPSGEEIWTDKYGRVKVQFHWDRLGKYDENSSCWVRVGQPWAGKTWGGVFLPRIGHEVIVDFLEGDPDRPIITGSVYNADTMPPYKLPDNQTQSGFKSRSSKGGSADNFNELRFEDKKDEEEVYFHAEKDFNRVVENNDTLKVGFEDKDKGDQSTDIFNNQTLNVGCSESSDGSQTTTVWKDRTVNVGSAAAGDGSQTTTIFKDRSTTLDTGNDAIQVKKGNRTINVDLGSITEEAMKSIELKVGASSIKIEPAKITIKSVQIAIEADGTLDAKSPMTTVKGDAMLTLSGGLIKIN